MSSAFLDKDIYTNKVEAEVVRANVSCDNLQDFLAYPMGVVELCGKI